MPELVCHWKALASVSWMQTAASPAKARLLASPRRSSPGFANLAKVALARKLAVILHRMLADGTVFQAA
jgi:hypothetical protein